jgi:hypothetical protein
VLSEDEQIAGEDGGMVAMRRGGGERGGGIDGGRSKEQVGAMARVGLQVTKLEKSVQG